LNKLTRAGVEFEFGEEQEKVMEDLKEVLLNSPMLKPINYQSPTLVILAMDTSIYAIGFHLAQCDISVAAVI
jgi:hypothetical protein